MRWLRLSFTAALHAVCALGGSWCRPSSTPTSTAPSVTLPLGATAVGAAWRSVGWSRSLDIWASAHLASHAPAHAQPIASLTNQHFPPQFKASKLKCGKDMPCMVIGGQGTVPFYVNPCDSPKLNPQTGDFSVEDDREKVHARSTSLHPPS